ncbi:MBL fold metallo-hydrolase [Pelosinus baikalensis]|uniref:MBL fold metallo-hydrolase n=1 Tax=Pelosinus baikalensis TaxID=2892015 RepID=A0ABS8HQB4_9FIRM|nr:MBL fold metallo-hydrolase [Pelosinus baikalensis]MCC5465381.1 MBL fold metallo-hydrolase [Pelosinus baikalensis]
MKCTIIVDNSASLHGGRPFLAELGFSLLIEYDNRMILFDTGSSQASTHNLSLLGIHPKKLDALVLSHGHIDHVGGLLKLLQVGKKQYPLYAHPGIFSPHYIIRGIARDYCGLPYTRVQLSSLGVDWRLSEGPQEIAPNLWLSGQIPRKTSFESVGKQLVTIDEDGKESHDLIADDTALFYAGKKGLVVISGCTHSGLVNTIQYGLEITGAKRLSGWIGGTHLGPAKEQQISETMRSIEELNPDFMMTGHCTGFAAMSELSRLLGNRFIPGLVGTEIELE